MKQLAVACSMSDYITDAAVLNADIARLNRRLLRETTARHEAEEIAERVCASCSKGCWRLPFWK